MRVRSYIAALILGCCLGGLVLFGSVLSLQQRVEVAAKAASDSALAVRDVGRLSDSLTQWLLLSDLILGSDETYLVDGALKLAGELERMLAQIETGTSSGSAGEALQTLGGFVTRQRKRLEDTVQLTAVDRQERLNGLLRAMDEDSVAAVDAVTELQTELVRGHDAAVAAWQQDQQQRDRMSTAGAALFVVWLGAMWLWMSRTLSSPLHTLADEARAALCEQRKLNLNLNPGGPREVVQLTEALAELVGTLDDQVRDRTRHLREANEQLSCAVEQAKAADQAKSAFLANMSHEIRTPLTAILGYAELLHRSSKDKADEEKLSTIIDNGKHLLALLNDILDLSKIEAGRLELERLPVSPFQVAQDVISLMEAQATAKQLVLESRFGDELPREIICDPTRVRQILVNLVGNAVKFTETGWVRLVVTCPLPETICFTVIDSGIGISPEAQSELFQPFTQSDVSMTRRFGGSGLGLAISQRLARLLGGEIVCSSQVGEGSTFVLTLPSRVSERSVLINYHTFLEEQQSTPEEASEPSAQSESAAGCRVLLVEDTRTNQLLISAFLHESLNADVTVCENGQLGYEAAMDAMRAGSPFDVILMDMQMPVLDGYGASRKLRADAYQGPIIALTAHAMAHDRQKCLDAGCNDYATKPIDPEQLTAKVREHGCRPLGERALQAARS